MKELFKDGKDSTKVTIYETDTNHNGIHYTRMLEVHTTEESDLESKILRGWLMFGPDGVIVDAQEAGPRGAKSISARDWYDKFGGVLELISPIKRHEYGIKGLEGDFMLVREEGITGTTPQGKKYTIVTNAYLKK